MKRIFLLLLIISFTSCGKSKTSKPANLIPKDTMVNLLFDMHLANRSRNIKNLQGDKKPNYFPLIYQKYHIDSMQFKVSHAYYMKELPEYIAIYKKLEDSISILLKTKEKQLKRQDSINKLKKKKQLKDLKLEEKLITKKLPIAAKKRKRTSKSKQPINKLK